MEASKFIFDCLRLLKDCFTGGLYSHVCRETFLYAHTHADVFSSIFYLVGVEWAPVRRTLVCYRLRKLNLMT